MIPTEAHRKRVIFVALLLTVGLAGLGARLYDLQVLRHQNVAKTVNRMHERRVKLAALRGSILDCNDNVLAHSVPVHTVIVDPQFVREEEVRRQTAKKPSQLADLTAVLCD